MTQQTQVYRTEILLNLTQHQALTEIARREGRSVAEVVSEMVTRELAQQQEKAADLEQYLAGMAEIQRHREEILAENGGQPLDFDVVEVINRMREERDARNLGLRSDCD